MKRTILGSALLLLCSTPFVLGQDQATTPDTNSGQSQNPPAATTSTPSKPDGTKVVGHDRDTIVTPKRNPVKVDANVVRAAQKELQDRNYNPGPIDGVVGPQTRAAVTKFQSE